MNRSTCFVIERNNQGQKEFLAATKKVWVGDWDKAIHFSNVEDAERYKFGYRDGDKTCYIFEYPWPDLPKRPDR